MAESQKGTTLVERKGSQPVSAEERQTTFWSLFLTWAGFSIVSSAFMVGAYCSRAVFITGMIGITIGALFKVWTMGMGAYIGAREGLAGTLAMRVPFGVKGRFITAIPMIFATAGWFGVQIGITSSAINELLIQLIPGWNMPIQSLYVILALLMTVVAVYGYRVVVMFQSLVVPVMIIVLAWVAYRMVNALNFSEMLTYNPENPLSLAEIINVLPAAGPALVIAAADTSRYAKTTRTATGAVISANLILYTGTGLLGFVGAVLAGTWDPAKVMVALGMGALALFLLIMASWTTNCLNAYWGGIALTTMTTGMKKYPDGIPRPAATMIVSLLGTLLALSGIYSSQGFLNFLIFLGATLAPANGILICEYYIIRRKLKKRIETEDIGRKNGSYWYSGGWHVPAVAAWAVAASFAAFLKDVTQYIPAKRNEDGPTRRGSPAQPKRVGTKAGLPSPVARTAIPATTSSPRDGSR